ncbi:insulinase family protein [candidate division KSB1 bacterium]|nr:insulinase family protein [candidate division KSB1 bacterium]
MIDQTQHLKTVLPNGVRVVTERIPHVRSISLGLWIEVGTRDELPEENGISHFIEHIMFKGTRRRNSKEIAESLEAVGGHLNAFTGKEVTCYYAHLLDEHLPIAIDVLTDLLTDSLFDIGEMNKERGVIIEEINAVDDTPEELIHELFFNDLFPEHALGTSTLGTRETVSSFSREQLLSFTRRHYTRNRIVVSAAGNIEHETLLNLLNGRLDSLSSNGPRKMITPSSVRNLGTVKEDVGAQTHICLGTRALRFEDTRKFNFLVMNTLLGGGMSSRLFQNIREKHGLAYSIYSFHDFMYDTGIFGTYIGTDPERETQAVGLLKEELARLRDEKVPATEIERTKNQLKGSLMLGLESTSSRMNRLANMEMYLGRYYSLDEVVEGIEHVTSEGVQMLAQDLFEMEKLTLTVIRPSAEEQEEDDE